MTISARFGGMLSTFSLRSTRTTIPQSRMPIQRWTAFAPRQPTRPSLFLTSRSHLSRPFHTTPRRPLRSNYSRFRQGTTLLGQLARDPNFVYYSAGAGVAVGAVYVLNLEEVPVSGRRRFNIISPETERWLSQGAAAQVREEFAGSILPEGDPRVQMVRRVLERLAPQAAQLGPAGGGGGVSGADTQWEVTVIERDEPNAFVVPGGKVFVFTGILPMCAGEDGLAAVLGHEIAHNVAHHTAERMSKAGVLLALQAVLFFFLGIGDEGRLVLDLVLSRPGSRAQESEADYLGLLMMARSCYDPEAAVRLWQRMEAAERVRTPQFLSTHPSSHNRMEKIQGWMPEAEEQRSQSDCGMIGSYLGGFRQAMHQREVW